ncbi:translation initiation factor-like protein eIF-2B subunit alpha [Peziza echinospora]|nr:translation initiation factor-like protein eIF-2B subunit alpha [Peziza echinospora]
MVSSTLNEDTSLGKGLVSTSAGNFDILGHYTRTLDSDPDLTMPIAAIESLVALLSSTSETATTISEFLSIIQRGITVLKTSVPNAISLSAGCDLFLRYIVRSLEDPRDFDACRDHLLSHGRLFVERAKTSRWAIAQFGSQVIRDNSIVLLHSHSRVVTALLSNAADNNVRFSAIVTETRPSCSGLIAARILRAKGIPVSVIPDNAVGYIMGKVTMVIVGAEGVVENGGIINAMGTYTLAVLAKASKKPFYVLAESHKFVRLFPLNQFDLPVTPPAQNLLNFTMEDHTPFSGQAEPVPEYSYPDQLRQMGLQEEEGEGKKTSSSTADEPKRSAAQGGQGKGSAPLVDFTGPEYITALISEGGVLTPSAVSEELIKIYS